MACPGVSAWFLFSPFSGVRGILCARPCQPSTCVRALGGLHGQERAEGSPAWKLFAVESRRELLHAEVRLYN